MIKKITYSEKSVNRLIQIYRDKPNFRAMIEMYAGKAQEIEDTFFNMLLFRDVETAIGAQLDIIGRIVGQDKEIADAAPFVFFGYLDGVIPDSTTGGFGDTGNPATGERYRSEEESIAGDVTLADPEYRLFIKARIIKNHTLGTINEIIAATLLLSDTSNFTIEESKMQFDINFFGSLSVTTLNLLQNFDLLPRPAGVLSNITNVKALVGHWKMNGDSTDSTLNANDGTDTSMAYSAGKINQAGDFDGTDSKIDLLSPSVLDNIFDGGGTIAAWVNASSAGEGSFGRVLDKANWFLSMNGTTTSMRFDHGFSGTNGKWTFPVTAGQYNHIVVVYDNSSVSNDPVVYVNNVTVAVTEATTPIGTRVDDSGQDLIIGNVNSGSSTFDGQIDDVRVYDRRLESGDVEALYNSGNGTEGEIL